MSLESLRPVKRPPLLHVEVQEAIKTFILENRLQANDPLPSEGELANKLGVSRNSVREAVKALESVGILETRRGSGLFLKHFSFAPLLDNLPYGLMVNVSELAELLEIRQALEVSLIAKAIEDMTQTTLSELSATVERMRVHAENQEEFFEDDRRFHQLLFENHGNRTLMQLLDTFWIAFRRAADFIERGNDNPLSTYRDHARVLEAIQKRDVASTRRALIRHYAGIQTRLKAAQIKSDTAHPAQHKV